MSSYSARAEKTLAAFGGGRLPHALLVEGRPAEAALACAKQFAAIALCSAEGPRPCGACRDCLKLERNIHPDFTVIAGEGKAKGFHIDKVREMIKNARMKPNEAESRVFLLENVHNMTVQAQNAILKIIEEPPKGMYIALTCENKSALLPTVLSRVTVISVEEQAPEEDAAAASVLEALLRERPLEALEALGRYEYDRAGFAAFLAAFKQTAASKLVLGAKAGGFKRGERERLLSLVASAEAAEERLVQNVNGPLLAAILCFKGI